MAPSMNIYSTNNVLNDAQIEKYIPMKMRNNILLTLELRGAACFMRSVQPARFAGELE